MTRLPDAGEDLGPGTVIDALEWAPSVIVPLVREVPAHLLMLHSYRIEECLLKKDWT